MPITGFAIGIDLGKAKRRGSDSTRLVYVLAYVY